MAFVVVVIVFVVIVVVFVNVVSFVIIFDGIRPHSPSLHAPVQAKGEKIKEEETKCQAMADAANADLAEAMPMLNAAVEALDTLNKKDISELKAYGRPPQLVEMVMQAVMILKVGGEDGEGGGGGGGE